MKIKKINDYHLIALCKLVLESPLRKEAFGAVEDDVVLMEGILKILTFYTNKLQNSEHEKKFWDHCNKIADNLRKTAQELAKKDKETVQ